MKGKENNRITHEQLVFMFMAFDMQLRALKNAQDKDMTLLLNHEEKQLYNLVIKKSDELRMVVERRFPREVLSFIDEEGSYLFLDLVSIIRNIENRGKIFTLLQMMKLFVDGKAKITEDGNVTELTGEELTAKMGEGTIQSDPADEVEPVRQG